MVLSDITPCLIFLLQHSRFTFAGIKGRQKNGLAMGSSHASVLCTLVLTIYEFVALRSPSWHSLIQSLRVQGIFIDGFRYVDDLRLLILHPPTISIDAISQLSLHIREMIWHKVSPLKTDNVNATVGLFLWLDKGNLRWLPASRDFYHTLMQQQLTRGLPSLQHSSSYASPKIIEGTIHSYFLHQRIKEYK